MEPLANGTRFEVKATHQQGTIMKKKDRQYQVQLDGQNILTWKNDVEIAEIVSVNKPATDTSSVSTDVTQTEQVKTTTEQVQTTNEQMTYVTTNKQLIMEDTLLEDRLLDVSMELNAESSPQSGPNDGASTQPVPTMQSVNLTESDAAYDPLVPEMQTPPPKSPTEQGGEHNDNNIRIANIETNMQVLTSLVKTYEIAREEKERLLAEKEEEKERLLAEKEKEKERLLAEKEKQWAQEKEQWAQKNAQLEKQLYQQGEKPYGFPSCAVIIATACGLLLLSACIDQCAPYFISSSFWIYNYCSQVISSLWPRNIYLFAYNTCTTVYRGIGPHLYTFAQFLCTCMIWVYTILVHGLTTVVPPLVVYVKYVFSLLRFGLVGLLTLVSVGTSHLAQILKEPIESQETTLKTWDHVFETVKTWDHVFETVVETFVYYVMYG